MMNNLCENKNKTLNVTESHSLNEIHETAHKSFGVVVIISYFICFICSLLLLLMLTQLFICRTQQQ